MRLWADTLIWNIGCPTESESGFWMTEPPIWEPSWNVNPTEAGALELPPTWNSFWCVPTMKTARTPNLSFIKNDSTVRFEGLPFDPPSLRRPGRRDLCRECRKGRNGREKKTARRKRLAVLRYRGKQSRERLTRASRWRRPSCPRSRCPVPSARHGCGRPRQSSWPSWPGSAAAPERRWRDRPRR